MEEVAFRQETRQALRLRRQLVGCLLYPLGQTEEG